MKSLLSALVMFVALAGCTASARAAGNAVLAFAPTSTNAHPGDAISVDVTVANVDTDPGLAQYDLTLHVDPAVLRIDGFADSGFITTGQTIVVCVPGTIDNTGGTAEVTCTPIPLFGLPGVSTGPEVVLLHGSFTALAPGTSPLTLSGTLAGPTGTNIPANFGSASIGVSAPAPVASPAAQPSSSPKPVLSSSTIAATATSTPASAPTVAPNTPPPAPTAAGSLKVPATGDGGSTGGYPWDVIGGVTLVLGSLIGAGSYAFWRRGRGRART